MRTKPRSQAEIFALRRGGYRSRGVWLLRWPIPPDGSLQQLCGIPFGSAAN